MLMRQILQHLKAIYAEVSHVSSSSKCNALMKIADAVVLFVWKETLQVTYEPDFSNRCDL